MIDASPFIVIMFRSSRIMKHLPLINEVGPKADQRNKEA